MEIIAVIPARGGSKSLKNKNLCKIAGKPLIYYAIKCAKESKFVSKVVVSTDSKKIGAVSKKFGAEVPFYRSKKLSSDKTLDFPVIWDVLTKLKLNSKKFEKNIILYLRPTQPLRSYKDINNCISFLIKNKNIDCVRTIRKAIYPPYWTKKLKKNKILPLVKNKYFSKAIIRRQDLPHSYMCDGYVDAIRVRGLLKEKKFPPNRSYGIFSNSKYFIDIDEQKDIDLINSLFKSKFFKKKI